MRHLWSLPFCFALILATSARAQVTTTGFSNQARTEAPGTLLSHPITNGSEPIGRTTSINYLNGWIMVGGEAPGSRGGSDLELRVYDISNPASPVRRTPSNFGHTYPNNSWHQGNAGWNAHGTAQNGTVLLPEVMRVQTFGGTVERGVWFLNNGVPNINNFPIGWNRSAQAGPWLASFPWYGSPDAPFTLQRIWQTPGGNIQPTLATFDHTGSYGGGDWHPMFFGDLLIYARSGSAARDGVVVYRLQYNNFDDPDPADRSITPQYVASLPGGFEGYWSTFYSDGTGLYVIGAATNVVMAADITPATLPGGDDSVSLIASLTVPGLTNAPYPVFQDQFGFIHNRKIDMNRLITGDPNPIVLTLNESSPPVPAGSPAAPSGVNTSQMSLALGNLWLTGGYPGGTLGQPSYLSQGMGVWVHQQAPDTAPPRVAYHIPQAGRTNYPRHAPLSFLIFEHPRNGAARNGIDFLVRPVGAGDTLGTAVDGFLIHDFSGVTTFTPTSRLAADTTYQVDFLSNPATETGFRDAAGNYIEPYSFRFSTGGGINAAAPPVWTSLTANDYQPEPNQAITVTAAASGTGALEYRFNFDGTWTAWSTSTSANFAYASAGRPRVIAQARDASGNVITNSLSLIVIAAPPAGPRPTQSSTLVVGDDPLGRRVWVVNPDANTVAVLDAVSGSKLAEYATGANPRSIARDGNGRYWITCFQSDEIRILNPDGSSHTTIALAYGSGPFGIAASPDGTLMYVTLQSAGRLHRYTVANPAAAPLTQTTFPTPRAIAVSADGNRVFVTRFLSPDLQGEIGEFSAALANVRTVPLSSANSSDGGDRAAGVPNYLTGIAISPNGNQAAVVSKQDNIQRGLAFGVGDLTHETTVRSVISFLDLTANAEIRHTRRDFDNSDSPSAVTYTPLGDTLLVTLQGNNALVGLDALNVPPVNTETTPGSTDTSPAVLSLEIGTGLAPQGILLDAATNRLFIQDFMGRSVTVRDAQPLLVENRTTLPPVATTGTVATELLSPTELLGKRIFYNAADPRMSADSYISCASCHLDGGHDGRTWDFTGRGEGFRRTTDLRGRSGMGHGNVHWSGNFDEIQDFEHDIRVPFGGTGFLDLTPQQFATRHPSPATGKAGLSSELDALAAYVTSLGPSHIPRSPNRNSNGTFTTAAVSGQAVFAAQNCASCHGGAAFTNSAHTPVATPSLFNTGTQSSLSGSRLGASLPGIDTPTLHGLHATRLYLHHGQAATLSEAFGYAGGVWRQATQAELSGTVNPATDLPNQGGGGYYRGALGGTSAHLLNEATASVRFTGIDGGSGGPARLAFRYARQYAGGTATLIVNGASQTINVFRQTPDNSWQLSGWLWYVTEVTLNPGTGNTIEIQRGNGDVHINGLLVGSAGQLSQAQAHRTVLSLDSTSRTNLFAYLTQLDGRDASGNPLDAPAPPAPQAPGIVSQPGSVTLAVGNTLNFAVTVSGTGPFTYEWRRGTTVVGTDSPELQIPSIGLSDAGSYTCTIANGQGSIVTAPAEVTVNPALTITTTTLPQARLEQLYSANLVASGGVSSRTWTLESGLLPTGLSLSPEGVISGLPTVAGRATFTVRVTDSSGSATQSLTLDAPAIGAYANDPDLILHFTFDEGSGNRIWDNATAGNNHATDVTTAQWATGGRFGGAFGPGNLGSAFAPFRPANQDDLNFHPRGNPYTISAWVRSTAQSGYLTVFSKDRAVSPFDVQYRVWMVNSPTSLQTVSGNQYGAVFTTPSSFGDGQWHLLTLVNFLDGATWRTRLYFDNGTSFNTTNAGTLAPIADLLTIGNTTRGGNGWAGQIDDLRIYRRALSQSEIAALYSAPQTTQTFGGWRSAQFTSEQQAASLLVGPGGDANGNGLADVMEFITGSSELSPLALALSGPPTSLTATLTFTRNSPARGVNLILEASQNLNTWTPLATSVNGAVPTGSATISETTGLIRTVTVSHSASGQGTSYRLRAEMP
jgi:hypothetical protein